MKKLIAIALVLVLALSVLACVPAQQASESETTVPATEQAEEKKTVYITLLCMNNMPTKEGAQQVQDELNRYLAEDAGKNYQVQIRDFLDLSSHMSGIDLALASGEELGVVLTDFRTGTMAANGQLLPLDPYLDNELAGAKALVGEDWLEAGTFNGEVYGLPVYKGVVCRTYLVCRKDIVDEVGFDVSAIKTIADCEPLFTAVKAAHPEMDCIVPNDVGSLGILLTQYGQSGYRFDFLGNNTYGTDSTGALIGDSKTVVNFYGSDEFAAVCKLAYDWNQKDLMMKEASVSPDTATELFPAGTAFSTIAINATSEETVAQMFGNGAYGTSGEFVAIPLDTQMLTASTLGLQYGIASTCTCPNEAADLMNLIWTDPYVMNLIVYGVEGTDYVVDADGVADWPEGQNVDTVPYTEINLCGAIGNQFNLKLFKGNSSEADLVLMESLIEDAVASSAMGFSFDASNVNTEIAAVQTVIDQYFLPLVNGEVNPDEYLPQFVTALENAGINKIIAEKQAQLDAYWAN